MIDGRKSPRGRVVPVVMLLAAWCSLRADAAPEAASSRPQAPWLDGLAAIVREGFELLRSAVDKAGAVLDPSGLGGEEPNPDSSSKPISNGQR